MEISDFKLVDVIGNSPTTWKFKAVVTITTKRFFRKQIIEKREVFRSYTSRWYFIDNGEFAPNTVNDLERGLEVEKGKELQYCLNT